MILKYKDFLLEHKLWGKSIEEFLNWINLKSENNWVWLDTETTGLPSSKYEVQLTQVSCIISKYDIDSNSFEELS